MFGDLDWPLNASRGLSAIAEFLVSNLCSIEYSTRLLLQLERRRGAHFPYQGRESVGGMPLSFVRRQTYGYRSSLRWYEVNTAW